MKISVQRIAVPPNHRMELTCQSVTLLAKRRASKAPLCHAAHASRNALLANSRAVLVSADLDVLLTMASNENVALANVTRDFSNLTPEQYAQNALVLIALFRVREYAWFQYQDGLLDGESLNAFMRPLVVRLTESEESLSFWNEVSPELDQGFVQFVNETLEAD